MRRIVELLIVFCLLPAAFGQNTNPQQNFVAQEQLAGPSLLMHFNDATANFKDSVSGNTFVAAKNTAYFPSPYSTPYAGYFNGTNTYVSTASTSALNTPAITMSAWVFINTLTNAYNAVMVNGTASVGTQLMIKSNGKIAIYISTSGGTVSYDGTGNNTLTAGNWYFLALTYSSTAGLVGYVNGVADGSGAANGTAVSVTAPTYIGYFPSITRFWVGAVAYASIYNSALTTTQVGQLQSGSTFSGLLAEWKLNEGNATSATDSSGNGHAGTWNGAAGGFYGTYYIQPTMISGAATLKQPGFDNTSASQFSAAFPYDGWSAGPNNTLGSLEWSVPWTMLVHLDRLNWNRAGALVLASKGDASIPMNSWWRLSLNMSGNASQLCFTRNGVNAAGSGIAIAQSTVCTNSGYDAMPNGFNYDVVLVDSGTGHPSSLSLYINGLNGNYIPETVSSGSYQYGFGAVNLAVAGGTGYANSTAFTSTGGGPDCTVSGSIPAVGGVPTAGALNTGYFNNYDAGCTSVPTIALTAPTGTGMTITGTLAGASMNSTTLPLMVPGYVSAGAYYGVAGTASTQTFTNMDEFAIFPGVLSQTQIQSLFYLTKFYQRVVKALPAVPNTVIFDDDGCGDTDNIYALALTIAAQKIGYIRLAGVVDSSGDGVSEAMYRQMLDEAGLAHVPMTIPSGFGNNVTACTAANRSTFNASTSQVASSYPQAKAMYRQIFASYPTTPVFVMLGGSFRGMADLMGSGADSISPLTGAQLIAQNAANGGAIYAQGLGANMSFSGDNSLQDWTAGQYVATHNGAMPIYWYGGQPQNTGPGVLSTRTSKDSIYLMAATLGMDTRQGYDSLPMQSVLSTLFSGGVNVAISGAGTGYAAQTPFTSTGGGANCVVTGIMVAAGGIPSSIISTGGSSGSALTYTGLGSGCFTAGSPPTMVLTAPTGTGAILSATTTTSGCGTVTITSATSGSTSTGTCSNHYFLPFSLNAGSSPAQGALMEWFVNSLVDPMPGGAPRGR